MWPKTRQGLDNGTLRDQGTPVVLATLRSVEPEQTDES